MRVGVIGAGRMGRNHIRVYGELGHPIIAYSDIDALDLDSEAISYRDYWQMLAEETLDAVSVCTPTSLHYAAAMECMSHGVPVLVEKPITTSLAAANEIVSFSRETGVLCAVGHIERYNPAVVALKERLGELGQIFRVSARRCGPYPGRTRTRDTGVALDLAIHDIDVMLYLLERDVEKVLALTGRWINEEREDGVLGLIQFEDGVIGSLDVNWVTPTKVRELTVLGERGMFVVDYLTQDLWFYENGEDGVEWDELRRLRGVSEGRVIKHVVEKREPLRAELEAFLSGENVVTAEEGKRALEVALMLEG